MKKIKIKQFNKNTTNDFIKEIEFLNKSIKIKTYLPSEEKVNLIELVMQNSIEFNFVNPIKTLIYFETYAVIKYTNIDLTEYLDDIYALHDMLATNGLIDLVIQTANKDYYFLWEQCQLFVNKYENYQNSLYGVVSQVVNDIPEKLSEIISTVDNFDFTKLNELFQNVSLQGGNSDAIAAQLLNR